MAARFSEISGEEIKKFAEKAVSKMQSKLQTRGWMFGSCEQKARILMMTLSNIKLKNWTNVTLDSSPKFAKSSVMQNNQLQNSSPRLSWLSGDDKLWCCHWCFSTKQPWNTERSFLVLYLNLCFRFTTAVTAKTVIWKFLSLNYFMLFAFNGFYWFCRKLSVIFLFINVKILLGMQMPVFVFSTVMK